MALTAAEALAAATEAVASYAPDAPAAIRTAAIGRLTDWIERFPADGSTAVGYDGQSLSTMQAGTVDALRASGAAELLAPWRRPRGRVIEAAS